MSENNESPATGTQSTQGAPGWFVIVAVIALIWNLLGAVAYLMRVYRSDETIAALPEIEQTYLESVPAWATAAFAFAVWGGLFGSLGLVLKKGWAYPLLVLSLLGVLVQDVHSLFMSNAMEVYGSGSLVMTVLVLAIGIYLVWLARSAKAKGWIS